VLRRKRCNEFHQDGIESAVLARQPAVGEDKGVLWTREAFVAVIVVHGSSCASTAVLICPSRLFLLLFFLLGSLTCFSLTCFLLLLLPVVLLLVRTFPPTTQFVVDARHGVVLLPPPKHIGAMVEYVILAILTQGKF